MTANSSSKKPLKLVLGAIASFVLFVLLLLDGIFGTIGFFDGVSDLIAFIGTIGGLIVSLMFGIYFSFFAQSKQKLTYNKKTSSSEFQSSASSDKYDLFISFKKSDENGENTPDVALARNLATALRTRGVKVFFSEDSLEEIGSFRYKADIDEALDTARVMVVVLTKAEYAMSQWVNYEWDSFYNDFLSGVKKNAKLFTYTQGVDAGDLHRTLRNVQNFSVEKVSNDKMVDYIINALKSSK